MRRHMRTILAALALSAVCCGAPVSAQTIDQLYAAAKTEKSLALWGAGPTAGYETAARAFEKKYPGIAVTITGGFSNVLNARIEEQLKARKVEADVVVFQTAQDMVSWNRRGLLTHFKPEAFDAIGPNFKDKDGAWIA